MSTWDERVTEFMRVLEWPVTMCDAGRMMAAWQREQLLTDDVIERSARELNVAGWTCMDGTHEPGHYDDCPYCRGVGFGIARIVLTAAVGDQS